VIIIGEHFVVHGSYAVAAAINKRAKVTVSKCEGSDSIIVSDGTEEKLLIEYGKFSATRSVAKRIFEEFGKPAENIKLEINSEIPSGSGLGSSAAISVATTAAITKFFGYDLTPEKFSEIATSGEKAIHGDPSGIDTEASIRGGMILYSRKAGAKPIPLNRGLQLLVAYSGQARNTIELIEKVRMKKVQFPSTFAYLSNALSFASLQFIDAMSNGDLPYLGALMSLGQAALSWIGVSNEVLDLLIEKALADGSSFGAKLTGAGGGGSVIALPKPEKAEILLNAISKDHPFSFIVAVPQDGLRYE
jgi:mevalonate kinase